MKRIVSVMFFVILGSWIMSAGVYAQAVLTLEDCISMALKNNSQYRIAQSRVGVAEANVVGAYSAILPRFSASAGGRESRVGPLTREYNTAVYRRDDNGNIMNDDEGVPIVERYVKRITETDKQVNNNYDAGVSFNQTVYDGGAWWNRIKQADRTRNAREHDEDASQVATITDVKRFYYELLRNENLLLVREEDVRLAEEQLKSAQSRYEIGVAAQIDVYTSRVSYNESKINLLNQERLVEIARANLNTVLGKDPFEPISIESDSLLTELTLTMDVALEKALDGHPQIKARREEIESARYGYKVAKSGLLPTITVSGGYSRFNPKFERVYSFIDRNYAWSYSLNLSIPLFDGLQTKSQIENAQYSMEIAEENFTDSQRQLTRDVRQYYITLRSYLQEAEMRDDNLVEAEENLRLARERYNVGAGTLLEVIDAQVRLTNARTQRVRAVYDAKIAEAQLAGALGVRTLAELQ